jgi:hypothetical protein
MMSSDDGSKIHDDDPPNVAVEMEKSGHIASSDQAEIADDLKAISDSEIVAPTSSSVFGVSDVFTENGPLSSNKEDPLTGIAVSPLPALVNEDVKSPTEDTDPCKVQDLKVDFISQRVVPLANPNSELHFPLLSLPIDSLHCIASFLTPIEWSSFGRSNRAASRVYREVSRRVRMHGFRCATEVVAAWVSLAENYARATPFWEVLTVDDGYVQKLGQQADAKELTALYIQNGVPIYPHSLGHSYHTLVWKMAIEAREMQTALDQQEGGEVRATRSSRSRVDRFFSERPALRAHEEYNQQMTYLEEKCLFVVNQEDSLGSSSGRSGERRRSLSAGARAVMAPDQPILQAGLPFARREPVGVAIRSATLRSTDIFLGLAGSQSTSKVPDTRRPRRPMPIVKIHQHLLDQHLLSRPSVNDQDGAMRTTPVSLSADFFHPHFARKSISSASPKSFFVRQSPKIATPANAELWDQTVPLSYTAFHEEGAPFPDDATSPSARGLNQRYHSDVGFAFDEIEADRDASNRSNLGTLPLEQETSQSPEPPAHSVLDDVELEIYSASSAGPRWKTDVGDGVSEIKSHLRTRFAAYQRRLESLLAHNDSTGFEECILDFWDEFLPLTANIQLYDRHTAVPRISCLHKFLTKPCPKAIGIVQCEIERIKINSKKKGVSMKGRFFPVYEYRLFIRHRPANSTAAEAGETGEAGPTRRDTVLIAAKNRGRKHVDASGVVPITSSAKKGVNNYFLYMPQQADVDSHFNSINEKEDPEKNIPNGASHDPVADGGAVLLGRLQSNIIGTEFQIFTPSICKRPARKTGTQSNNSAISSDDDDVGYDSGMSSDNASATSRRRNRFSRRLSIRRSNVPPCGEQPSPIEEEITADTDSRMKRTGSWPVLSYTRSSRTSRRAIANTSGVPDTQQYQTILCEEEDGAITYTANLLGNRPRIMDVCIPRVAMDGTAGAEWKRYLESCDDTSDAVIGNRMLQRFKQLQQRLENQEQNNTNEETNAANEDGYMPPDDFGLLALQNRPPWWNIELGAFVLNFGGRVSVASVKNFQLCDRTDHDNIMLQFGRIHGRHSFTMDFKYPLTAVQAFAIAISSLQSKISFG